MSRLPQPGGDNGNWGDILNDFLSQSHKTDGTLKDSSVTANNIASGAISETLLDASLQAKVNTTVPDATSSSAGKLRLAGDLGGTAASPTVPALSTKVAKGELLFNVKDYGAIADGTTNAASAIQSAISAAVAAGGGVVYFPAGTYVVGSRIALKSKIRLLGGGREVTTIRALGSVTTSVLVGLSGDAVTDVMISGLMIDAAYATSGADISGIQITNGTRVTVKDCVVMNSAQAGILFGSCSDSEIFGCSIRYSGQRRANVGFGVLLSGGTKCKVHSNSFYGCNGMNIGGNTNATYASVVGNICDHTTCPRTTVNGGGQAPASTGTLVVASTAGFPAQGTLSVQGITGAITYTGVTETSFTGCAGASGTPLDGGVARNGYESIGFTSGCASWIVSANHSIDSGDNGISCSGERAVVSDNIIDTCQFMGVNSAGDNNVISGNLIRNTGTVKAANYAGINLASVTNNVVSNNRIMDDRGASAMMPYGIRETGTAGGHRYSNNRIVGTTVNAYSILSNTSSYIDVIGVSIQTYSASMTSDAASGKYKKITATNTDAFTINNPINAFPNAVLTFDIINSSGGVLGAITWGASFRLAGAFVAPANGSRRTVSFYYDGVNWVETQRSMADM